MKTNKELKAEYKLMKFPAGVYQIRNIKNGKFFIDSSLKLDKVWNSQKFQLQLGGHEITRAILKQISAVLF